jgi:hypothetical protein
MIKKHEVETVIAHFGGIGPMSVAFDVGCETVKQWRRDQTFPIVQGRWVDAFSKFKLADLPISDRGDTPLSLEEIIERTKHMKALSARFAALAAIGSETIRKATAAAVA